MTPGRNNKRRKLLAKSDKEKIRGLGAFLTVYRDTSFADIQRQKR
jgi:hypothetical protein